MGILILSEQTCLHLLYSWLQHGQKTYNQSSDDDFMWGYTSFDVSGTYLRYMYILQGAGMVQ